MKLSTRRSLCLVCCLMSSTSGVYAKVDVSPYLSVTRVADDNVFRVDDSISSGDLGTGIYRSDVIYKSRAGINVAWPVSRQQLNVSASLVDNRYENNSYLDNLERNLDGSLDWQVGSDFSGVMEASNNVSLRDFDYVPGTQKSERTISTGSFSGNWRYLPVWQVGMDLQVSDTSYDTNDLKLLNSQSTLVGLRWDYFAYTGSRIGLKLQSVLGKLPNRDVVETSVIDNEYTQNSALFTVLWKASEKSVLDAEMGWVERVHPNISSQDYDGMNASLRYAWTPTGKLNLSLEGYKRVVSSTNLLSGYSENTGFTLSGSWAVTEKLRFKGNLSRESRDYSSGVGVVSSYVDVYGIAGIKMIYSLYKQVQLSTGYSLRERSSDLLLRDYNSEAWNIGVRLKF